MTITANPWLKARCGNVWDEEGGDEGDEGGRRHIEGVRTWFGAVRSIVSARHALQNALDRSEP